MKKNLLSSSAFLAFMLFCGLSSAFADNSLPAIEGIEVAKYSGIYDSMAHTVSVKGTQPGDYVTYSQDGINWTSEILLFTDVTSQKVFVKVDREGYAAFTGADSVIITKRYLKFTSSDATKVYDGTPLTCGIVYLSGDGILGGEGLNVEATGTQTDAGVSDNTFDVQFKGRTFKADNYEIEKIYGTLTVEKPVITLKTNNAKKVYDGTPLTDTTLNIEGDFAEGEQFNIIVIGTQTKVGSSENKCRITAVGGAKKSNYEFVEEYGTLEVTLPSYLSPEFARMYSNSNFVLEASDFTAKLKAITGTSFTLQAANIVWYKRADSGLFEQCGTGFYYTQADGSSMTGAYYVTVTVPEVESVLGTTTFSSDIVEISASAESESQLKAYSISGKPVGDDYKGVVIYENGFKTIK